ncbi:MAG: hypothetical protein ACRD6U_04835 [Nitrososphaeraceae archaeon]
MTTYNFSFVISNGYLITAQNHPSSFLPAQKIIEVYEIWMKISIKITGIRTKHFIQKLFISFLEKV